MEEFTMKKIITLKTAAKLTNTEIKLPEGKFYSNNCCDCIYYNTRDTDSTGRGYCSSFNTHYFPEERNGCFRYVKR